MKTMSWLLLFFFLFSGAAIAGPAERRISDRDAGTTIDLDDSSVAVIELEANPSTGNSWQMPESLGKNFRIVRREFEPSVPGLLGGSGIERIYVVGTTVGKSDMTFEYRRSFEKKARKSMKFSFNTLKKFKDSYLSSYQTTETETSDAQSETPALSDTLGLPDAYNYCTVHGGCPPVRDQGLCGGCWAFATQGPLECLIKGEDGVSVDLSEQYLLSCNDEDWGCNGGFWAHDYNMNKKVNGETAAGAPLESTMPFQGHDTSCNPPHAKAYKITSWGYVCGSENCRPTTDQLKQAIYDHGPLSVAVCVDYSFQAYSGGVFTGSWWPCYTVNHGVVLVGWDDSESCWILRNSWGSSWGESGYMRIRYGVAQIGTNAAYIVYDQGSGLSSTSSTSSTSSSGGCDNSPSSTSSTSSTSSSSSSGCQ